MIGRQGYEHEVRCEVGGRLNLGAWFSVVILWVPSKCDGENWGQEPDQGKKQNKLRCRLPMDSCCLHARHSERR